MRLILQNEGMLMNVNATSSEVVVSSIKQKLGMK
jgi:hypothetical protein